MRSASISENIFGHGSAAEHSQCAGAAAGHGGKRRLRALAVAMVLVP